MTPLTSEQSIVIIPVISHGAAYTTTHHSSHVSTTSCVSMTAVTWSHTTIQCRHLDTMYGTAEASRLYMVFANWNLLKTSTIGLTSVTRTLTIRQSPVNDSHQIDQPNMSCALRTHVTPVKQPYIQRICQQFLSGRSKLLATHKAPAKLTAIPECQSSVVDTPSSDFYQKSAVADMRLVPYVSLKATADATDFLSYRSTSCTSTDEIVNMHSGHRAITMSFSESTAWCNVHTQHKLDMTTTSPFEHCHMSFDRDPTKPTKAIAQILSSKQANEQQHRAQQAPESKSTLAPTVVVKSDCNQFYYLRKSLRAK